MTDPKRSITAVTAKPVPQAVGKALTTAELAKRAGCNPTLILGCKRIVIKNMARLSGMTSGEEPPTPQKDGKPRKDLPTCGEPCCSAPTVVMDMQLVTCSATGSNRCGHPAGKNGSVRDGTRPTGRLPRRPEKTGRPS